MLTITVWPMLPMARMKVVLHHSLPWALWACWRSIRGCVDASTRTSLKPRKVQSTRGSCA